MILSKVTYSNPYTNGDLSNSNRLGSYLKNKRREKNTGTLLCVQEDPGTMRLISEANKVNRLVDELLSRDYHVAANHQLVQPSHQPCSLLAVRQLASC